MTRSFNQIVAGFDGSSGSHAALDWAAAFAATHDSTVIPIHAWDFPPYAIGTSVDGSFLPSEETLQTSADTSVRDGIEIWRGTSSHGDRVAAPEVSQASAGAVLTRRSASADLVVVGSRGIGAVVGFVLGSVSSYVAAHTHCAVCVVPEERAQPADKVESVVVGHDGSPRSDEALAWAIDAFPGATIEVVHAWRLPLFLDPGTAGFDYDAFEDAAKSRLKRAISQTKDRARSAGCNVVSTLIDGDARTKLNEHARHADVLVLGVQAHHGMRRMFMGSVAQATIHHLTAPTVLVPTEATSDD